MNWEDFTKEELIEWIKTKNFRSPKISELFYIRWSRMANKNQKESEQLFKEQNNIDFKERDRLAKEFNKTNDNDKKLKIIKEMKQYDDFFKKHIQAYEKLRKKEQEANKVYGLIDMWRKKE